MFDAVARLVVALEGRYRFERQLGEGGMATVYLAKDLRHNRDVALKVLKPKLAAVVGSERFLAEIETTASLQHPHILPLFDSGEGDGFLFYVMPLVEGESLRDRLDREHQLPVDEAVEIATKVASALDYAHRQAVIHRDIKPANILLHDGEPLVSDFGIALAVSPGDRLTETGLSLGTPHYMSPEQATGDQSVGPATDIWALGCVLYEMLAGEPPYAASTPQAVLGQIITADVPLLSEKRPSTPPNVEEAVLRALEKVAADRFRTATDFRRALADPAFRHTEQIDEAAPTFTGRNAIVGGVLLLALTGVATAGWLLHDADARSGSGVIATAAAPTSIAVIPFENVSGNEEDRVLAEGMHTEILTQLDKIHLLVIKPRASVPGVRYVVTGELLRAGGTVRFSVRLADAVSSEQLWSDSFDREVSVENLLAIQRELALRIAAAVDVEISPRERANLELEAPENLVAYKHYLEGKIAIRDISQGRGSRASLRAAEEHLESAIALEPEWAAPHAALGLALHWAASSNWDPARNYPRSMAALEQALRLDSLEAGTWSSIAFVRYHWQGDFVGSEEAYRRVEELTGEPPAWGYGLLLTAWGRYQEAIEALERAVPVDPLSLVLLSQLGEANVCAGRYSTAIRHLENVEELLGSQAPSLSGTSGSETETRVRELLPYSYFKEGRGDEALVMAENVARAGSGGGTVAAVTFALAGMTERARELLDDAERDPLTLRYTRAVVAAAVVLGDRDAAIERLEWAADQSEPGQRGIPTGMQKVRCLEEVRSLSGDPRYERILRRIGFP